VDAKKCEKCGTENPSNATFCSECGESLPEVKSNPISKGMSYWKNQNKGFKILTGFLGCCIGAFIILMIIAAAFPTTNLSLANTTANIDNQTIEYLLIGHTEPNATVKLTSKSLNLNGMEITPESNGTFEYKLQIPTNTSAVDVTITAKVPNKSENQATTTIKRPSPPTQSTANKTTSPAVASDVFENKYYKFTTPPGTTVRDSNGNLAPAGGDNENLQLWDSSVNSKDLDGKEIGYAEINTGRMDGNAQDTLIKLGYTSSKTIAGYQSYYVLTPANGGQEAFGDYTIILGESKVQPGRTDTLTIEFDSDTADKIKIFTDSLVIKSSVTK